MCILLLFKKKKKIGGGGWGWGMAPLNPLLVPSLFAGKLRYKSSIIWTRIYLREDLLDPPLEEPPLVSPS